ncbi:unnamed protein product [Angiostrongylus costaricensis]|uniref:LRAT domain-containing protein n=1 Tax=Angiostrongylus costaricensis TaxID=334426 RepID=A0A0R3PC94_ANGCS|nr:unnamed protein product [Angiostrongylus costaricensis]
MLGVGQLVSEWTTGAAIAPHVELGDLLEFRRVAQLGGVPRSIYAHWAVYIGRQEGEALVVHLSGDGSDFQKFDGNGGSFTSFSPSSSGLMKASLAQVRCDKLMDVAGEDLVRVNNAHDADHQPFPPSIIVERATLKLGSGDYNLVMNNCEHFVKWCRYGNKISGQAVAIKSLALATTLACFGVPPLAAVGAGVAFLALATPVSKLANRYFGSNFSMF